MNIREIYLAASSIDDPKLRAMFLATVCRDDHRLRQRIEQLLAASGKAEQVLDQPQRALQQLAQEGVRQVADPDGSDVAHVSSGANVSTQLGHLPTGTIIGPYQLLQVLGEGGMGVVYSAKQSTPVPRQVALKILRPLDASRNVLARFEQERQALAMMDHSSIAKILDAGSTAEGLPYFAMELVKGIPINQYCDQENLSPQERLELFIPVCSAVQHAHQKGIIHRDLKPSNILVALYDGKPVPKIIDFGVAKAVGLRLSNESIYTEIGSIVGTLEYMAPEQAELNNLDIDTRADVYSLGVVLYELLTGEPPFTRQQLKSAAFEEMIRIIREVDPPKPSTKVSSSNEAASVAAHRRLEPKQLAIALSGDLDWVVMKALAKERTQRYQTIGEFSADIQRFLNIEPVAAGPPSFTYRARRFLRRNKTLSAAALVAMLAVIAGVIGISVGVIQARTALVAERAALEEKSRALIAEAQSRREAEMANQKTMQAFDSLTSSFTERWLSRQDELTQDDRNFLSEILAFYEDIAKKKNGNTQASNQIRVVGLRKAADLHFALGGTQEAFENYQKADQLYKELAPTAPNPSEYLNGEAHCLRMLAILLDQQGDSKRSEQFRRQAIKILTDLVNSGSAETATCVEYVESLTDFGSFLHRHGKNSEADIAFQQAEMAFHRVEDRITSPSGRQSLYASMLYIRCYFLRELGRVNEVLADGKKAIELYAALLESGHDSAKVRRGICSLHILLGSIYRGRGELELAQTEYQSALDAAQALVDHFPLVPQHGVELLEAHRILGENYNSQGNPQTAVSEFQKALAISKRLLEDFPNELQHQLRQGELSFSMGLALRTIGDYAGAQRELEESVRLGRMVVEKSGEPVRYQRTLANSLHALANVHVVNQDFDAAKQFHQDSIAIRKKMFDSNPEVVGLAQELGGNYCDFGQMLIIEDRPAEAVQQLDLATEILQEHLRSHPLQQSAKRYLRTARKQRGVAQMKLENWKEALTDFEKTNELGEGDDRAQIRQNRLVCISHIDPDWGIREAEALLKLEAIEPQDQFAAARAFAQISGTHVDASKCKLAAERCLQLLKSLNETGALRNPVTLDRHDEFRNLGQHADFNSFIESMKLARKSDFQDAVRWPLDFLTTNRIEESRNLEPKIPTSDK
jgi:serine/threonine protein kinase